MTEREFIDAFERLEVDTFHHRDHVRLGFAYLRAYGLVEALVRFRAALRAFAAHHGTPEQYHETITLMFLLLIHERRGTMSFAEFETANPDLFTWKPSVLDRLYAPETLQSDAARATLLLPDLASLATR